jgi:virulence-associated protein VagC
VEAILAKIFWSGGSQAIRLPKTMRLPGSEVRITRRGKTLVLSPIAEGEGWGDFWERLLPLAAPVRRHATRAADRREPL